MMPRFLFFPISEAPSWKLSIVSHSKRLSMDGGTLPSWEYVLKSAGMVPGAEDLITPEALASCIPDIFRFSCQLLMSPPSLRIKLLRFPRSLQLKQIHRPESLMENAGVLLFSWNGQHAVNPPRLL